MSKEKITQENIQGKIDVAHMRTIDENTKLKKELEASQKELERLKIDSSKTIEKFIEESKGRLKIVQDVFLDQFLNEKFASSEKYKNQLKVIVPTLMNGALIAENKGYTLDKPITINKHEITSLSGVIAEAVKISQGFDPNFKSRNSNKLVSKATKDFFNK